MDEITSTVERNREAEGETLWYQIVSFEDAKAFIQANITSAARSFIAIGYYLKYIRNNELFAEEGHSTLWEFAQEEFGISKSTASRYMSMNDRFSKNGNSPVVDDRYQGFEKSKLQEMLSLTDEQIEQVTPEMKVQEIRSMRIPKEIPYFELEGQMEFESDFPEILPDTMFPLLPETIHAIPQQSQSFMMSVSDLLQEPVEIIAKSQQEPTIEYGPPMLPADRCEGCQHNQNEICNYPDTPDDYCVLGDKRDAAIPEERPKQPELPLLKNNDQRAAFVDAYETWTLWIETVETGERYYRYDLSDGTGMVVKVYHAMLFDFSIHTDRWEDKYREGWGKQEYYLLQERKFFKDCEVNRSTLIEKLKEIQKKGKGEQNDK